MKRVLVLALLLIVSVSGFSQAGTVFQPGSYRDGIYDKENSTNRRFIPYTPLREADVQWTRRIWREIDMREKINQPLYYPADFASSQSRISFLQVLTKHIMTGEVIAFKDEQFLIPMSLNDIRSLIRKQGDSVDQSQFNEAGEEVIVKTLPPADSAWMYKDFRTLKLKEDWFFDRQKSVMEVRILGMGIFTWNEDKESMIEQFWVYFPACRPFFAKYEVFNVKNDAERRTYDDIFWKRMFNSKITKESNVYDRVIVDYSHGIDALLESDRIKNDIFLYEHDMWHF